MYSKNDYRYYLENQLMHSDDYFAHYGVKGMKWHKKHTSNGGDAYNDFRRNQTWQTSNGTSITFYGQNQKNKDMRADRKQLHDNVNRTNPYKIDSSKSLKRNIKSNVQVHKDRKQLKKIADKTVDRYYNGKDTGKYDTVADKYKKNRKPLTKDSFKREKPKGKKLKGGGNIYVSHS